ncbi:MAG: hypothetical protein AAF847_09740 [Bacteroidota bacterium]
MRNLRLVSLFMGVLAIMLFFAACEKENMDSVAPVVTPQPKTIAQFDENHAQLEAKDVLQLDEALESRGTKTLVYTLTTTVAANAWKTFAYTKANLAGYKYTAVVTPIGGDPDLYIYGYDLDSENPWRYIRRSATAGADESTLSGSDLNTAEAYGYFAVYGYTASSFTIRIYREDICASEDCISVRTANVKAVQEGSRYLITDGLSRMFIAPNSTEAKQIVKVFHHYDINQSCFVGRPGASFFYLNKDGNAPVGAMSGEDCISFNLNTIEVKQINGRWKIVDGNHWMFDFEGKEDEARAAFCIIKKYGFTKSCYVGRPNPSLQYLRQ